ncbi:MAG: LysR substrate-binding domain-containing protein, partial [Pseudomonadota bacterium]
DEAITRLTAKEYEGKIVLGVPHDIVYPAIPHVLRHFAAEYPRIQVQLLSSFTSDLKARFADGDCDLIMTTEDQVDAGAETLAEQPLIWLGATGGTAWRDRPLRLGFEHRCIFRRVAQSALDQADIPWEMAVESGSIRTIEATVAADLAVTAQLLGTEPPQLAPVPHQGALPELGTTKINLHVDDTRMGQAVSDMAEMVRGSYRSVAQGAWTPAHRRPAYAFDSQGATGVV